MLTVRFFWILLLGIAGAVPLAAAPKITGFGPRLGGPGTTVTINGSGLGTVNAVNFNGAQATIIFASANTLQVIVPPNAITGPIYVRDTQGFTYDTSAALLVDFLAAPRITSIKRVSPPADSPAEEVRIAPGNIIEITGANYLSFTDPGFAPAVRVDFTGYAGAVRLVPTTVGTTVLQVQAPNTGVSGPLTVVTPVGSVTFPGDVYYQPLVSRFTPTAAAGSLIEIVGVSLKGANQVLFGAEPATPVSVTPTNFFVKVPPITTPVRLTVFTPGGAYLTSTNFNLAPTIGAFTPAGGIAGTPVTLTGTGLAGATKVRFGNLDAPVVSAAVGRLETLVPLSAITGPITVITPWGTNITSTNFFLPPKLTSVTPNRGKPGTVVTLTGSSLTGATDVRFGGTPAVFVAITDTTLSATVPEGGQTGAIVVSNPGGTSIPGLGFTVLGREPIVDAFTPEFGIAGTVVTLSGLNFLSTTGIEFSNAPASSFVIKSDTSLSVTVPAGARTGPVVVKNVFGSGRTTRNFIVGTNASLSLTFSANPSSVLAGEPLVLNLEVRNEGPLPAAGTKVTLQVPDGLDYVDSTLTSGSVSLLLDGLVWDIGTVTANQSILGYLRMKPRFIGSFPVVATAATTTPDPVPTDNQQSLTVQVVRPQLNLRGRAGGTLVLGWSTHAVDYVLESAPALQPFLWSPVSDVPVPVQDELRVAVPLTGPARWFRLAPR